MKRRPTKEERISEIRKQAEEVAERMHPHGGLEYEAFVSGYLVHGTGTVAPAERTLWWEALYFHVTITPCDEARKRFYEWAATELIGG